ncbi:MAG: hypothetical protein ACO32I_07700 [Candidatus Limnocylindrus sp.]
MESSRSPLPDCSVDPLWARGPGGGVPPTHRLLVAIIRRAVWDFVLYKDAKRTKDPVLHEIGVDAAGWLFWDGQEECDSEGRYTFLHICSILGLDPRRIREIAARLTRDDIQRLNNGIKEE